MSENSKIFNPQAKIALHLDKVLNHLNNKPTDPITLEVDPSNACNHSCPFCISGHIHLSKFKGTEFFDRRMMDEKDLMSLCSDVTKMKIDSLTWTGGGEPTMNPHLKKAMKYINSNSKIKMGMFSNGSMFSKFDMFDTIVDTLSWIRISMDAGSANSYDKLRVTNKSNNFEIVVKNIKKLIAIKKKKKSKIVIGVGFVVSKDNYKEVIDFAKLFKNMDVDYCQYKPEIVQIERNGKLSKKKEQISSDFWLHKVIKQLDEAREILGNKFECNSYKLEDLLFDSKNYGRNYKECIGSQFQPCIGADGNVYVCTNHRGHKEYSYGSIKDKPFKAIWGNMKKRKCIMNKINNTEKFSNCSQLCKPHESNKMVWQIKENLHNKKYMQDLKNKAKVLKKSILHSEFI
jgi:cyclic pyranopterin phosphate synthase